MQKMGVEPTRYFYHTDLNRARLPIPPLLTGYLLRNVLNYNRLCKICQEQILTFGSCPKSESNQRHEDFQSSALPTELSGPINPKDLHERAGIRTRDNLIKSQVLYRLSYTPLKCFTHKKIAGAGFEPTTFGL